MVVIISAMGCIAAITIIMHPLVTITTTANITTAATYSD